MYPCHPEPNNTCTKVSYKRNSPTQEEEGTLREAKHVNVM
jgi:hypothetical protein